MTDITRAGVRRRTVQKPDLEKSSGAAPERVSPSEIKGRSPGKVKYLKGVFFGPPKSSKTTAACSGRGVLLIQFDPEGDATETLEGRDDITVVEPETQKEIDDLIKNLHAGAHKQFSWIVVDSVTFLFLLLGGKNITDTFKSGKDIRRAYGQAGAAVQQIVHDLVLLPNNVIFTAHLERVSLEDENGLPLEQKLGENEVKLAVSPMVWRVLGPAVSFVGRTFKEETYVDSVEGGKKKRNKVTRYAVSFNDGDRSPAGSRLKMDGEYEITTTLLSELADTLLERSN